MSKLTRQTQTIFGGTGSTSNFGQFGSLAASSPATTKNIATIQSLAAWLAGWQAATIGTLIPAYQDMNSVHYVAFYQLCYLLQEGIAEYDAGTTYYTNSFCQYNGLIYQSLIDTNLNNEPDTSPSDWQCMSQGFGANVASASSMTLGNDGTSFKITGTTTINNITIKPAGIIVNLVFTTSLLVNTGGNLLLNNGPFSTTTTSTLVLLSDGTNWYELSRSPEVSGLGAWVSLSANVIYGPALTDGTVQANATANSGSEYSIGILTDSSSTPTTERGRSEVNAISGTFNGFVSSKVRKGDYYKIDLTYGSFLYGWWIPDST